MDKPIRKQKTIVDQSKVIITKPRMLCSRCYGENCNCNWLQHLLSKLKIRK